MISDVIAAMMFDCQFLARCGRASAGARSRWCSTAGGPTPPRSSAAISAQIVANVGAEIAAARASGGAGQRRDQLVQPEPRLHLVHDALADRRSSPRSSVLAVTGQSVARERELGTFDQLVVSPLRTSTKSWSARWSRRSCSESSTPRSIFILAQLVFGVPFTGARCCSSHVAVHLSDRADRHRACWSRSRRRRSSRLSSACSWRSIPLILLSGYTAPIDNMPFWLQTITYADPARYFIAISQGLFLKGMTAADVFHQLWPLAIIACVTLGASAWLFRARME